MKLSWSKMRLKVLSAFAIGVIVFNAVAAPAAVNAALGITPQNLIDQHNALRRSAGLPALKLNNTLAVSAQRKAQAMLETNCWSHYCPSGKEPWDFFKEAGYTYKVAGENLAEGFFSVESVIQAWMNSPTHKENILRGDYEEIGFGIVQGSFQGRNNNVIIAVHFGTPSVAGVSVGTSPNAQLPSPTILNPQSGQALNTQEVTISGTAPQASEVRVFNNGELLTTIDANQGIFTRTQFFGPGDYTLTAQSRVGERSATSTPVRFSVDVTSDPIITNNVVFNSVTSGHAVLLVNQPNLQSAQITIAGRTYMLTTHDATTWQTLVDIGAVMQTSAITATTTDKAGNVWSGEISAQEIKNKLVQAQIQPVVDAENSGRVISADLKVQGNIFFIGSLLVFFLLDFLRLRDTGLTKSRGFTHLHVALIVIAIIILLAGTFSANILNGLKLF